MCYLIAFSLRWSCSGSPAALLLHGSVCFCSLLGSPPLLRSQPATVGPRGLGPPTGSQSASILDVPDAHHLPLPSPLLLPDLGHVQAESLEAFQRLDVLRVEGDVDHHQPAAGDVHVNVTGLFDPDQCLTT